MLTLPGVRTPTWPMREPDRAGAWEQKSDQSCFVGDAINFFVLHKMRVTADVLRLSNNVIMVGA